MTKRLYPPSRFSSYEPFRSRPKPTNEIWQHAILDSDDRIITIGYYPRAKTVSRTVIPIPDDQTPHPGWFYNRSTKRFQREEPE